MNNDVVVKVENVSKKFCRQLKKWLWYGVKDVANEVLCRDTSLSVLRDKEFWALNDVSFQLRRGECLGLIGHNGAGKSTMLKLLNGLIKPDGGTITMRGNVCALIELGAGFNPVLTGRENVYVNASVLGIPKRQTDKLFDEIVDFADIGDFIDTPVQNYSSGMKVRLGFAIAAQMRPDVLLIDEVLAVGDLSFRIKCYNKIEEMIRDCAVIIVSHNMPSLARITSRCMVLNKGNMVFEGNPQDAISHYYAMLDEKKLSASTVMPDSEARVENIRCITQAGRESDLFEYNEPMTISFNAKVPSQYKSFLVCLLFMNQGMELVAQCDSQYNNVVIENNGQEKNVSVHIPNLLFKPGKYILNITLYDKTRQRYLYWNHYAKTFMVKGDFVGSSHIQFTAGWSVTPIGEL